MGLKWPLYTNKMSAFDPALEDWQAYLEQFNLYYVANDIEKRHTSTLGLLPILKPKQMTMNNNHNSNKIIT